MAETILGVKLPIQIDANGDFVNITDALENIKQSMKMVILTNPGEKIMNPSFGVGIRNYLFENKYIFEDTSVGELQKKSLETTVRNIIIGQIKTYIPLVDISSIDIAFEENIMFLTINYNFADVLDDTLVLEIT